MIKGAIFDLDGTLLDSMLIWDTVGEDYLRSLGIEPRENLAETFKTFTLEKAAEYLRQHYGVTQTVAEILDGVNGTVGNFYRNTVSLKKGVREFLERLSLEGVKMCIATVTDRYLAEAALERLGVRDYFSEIFTTAEVGCDKTTPQIYRAALAHLGTKKCETVVFEDACHALMTAKNDGFLTAAVYDKHEEKQEKLKEIAEIYITDFDTVLFKSF